MFKSSKLAYSGLIGVAILWLSVGTSIVLTQFNILANKPISYLGVYPDSKYLFNGGLIITSLLFIIFALNLRSRFRVSRAFITAFILGQLCQITVALTPYNTPGVIKLIHVIAAFSLAFTLPVTMFLFKRSSNLSSQQIRVTKYFLIFELILFTLGISTFIFASRAGALSEIVTAIAFDIWIGWLSFSTASLKTPS